MESRFLRCEKSWFAGDVRIYNMIIFVEYELLTSPRFGAASNKGLLPALATSFAGPFRLTRMSIPMLHSMHSAAQESLRWVLCRSCGSNIARWACRCIHNERSCCRSLLREGQPMLMHGDVSMYIYNVLSFHINVSLSSPCVRWRCAYLCMHMHAHRREFRLGVSFMCRLPAVCRNNTQSSYGGICAPNMYVRNMIMFVKYELLRLKAVN